jgi:antitoxin CptB
MNTIPPRLRWQCRRGMLELDVLLGNFLTEAYVTISPSDQELFVELLACTDQELYEWLTGRTPTPVPSLVNLVHQIREHAKNRHST